MTPEKIELVQTSFKKVVPIAATAADRFYDRLFEIVPAVRSMFPPDMMKLPNTQPNSTTMPMI